MTIFGDLASWRSGRISDPQDARSAQKTRFWDQCDRSDAADGREAPSGRGDRAV